jgi:hypothetical protein
MNVIKIPDGRNVSILLYVLFSSITFYYSGKFIFRALIKFIESIIQDKILYK